MNYNKKSITYLTVFVIVVLVFAVGIYLVYRGVFDDKSILEEEEKVKTYQDIIDDLSAPRGAGNEVSEEIIQDLTPPSGNEASGEQTEQIPEVSKEIINSLTAPE